MKHTLKNSSQTETPTSGDFDNLVEKNMKYLEIIHAEVTQSPKAYLKKKLKIPASNASFEDLKKKLQKHK